MKLNVSKDVFVDVSKGFSIVLSVFGLQKYRDQFSLV